VPIGAVLAGVVLAAVGPRAADDLHRRSRRIMGSLAEIQVYHADQALARGAVTLALDEMERVEALLSTYQPASELSRMNAAAAKAPFVASRELYDFVRRCRAYHDQTLGTFDPTIGPVVRAWGFFTPRPARPGAAEAAAAKARSGFDKVRLDDAARTVSFAVEGLELDPGGIGKGYAADRAVAVLRRNGISSALVSAGGSTLFALGHPPGREGWRVAVQDPSNRAAALRFVLLRDNALSTSGSSQKFVELDGRRYAHLIDPRTGEPGEGVCQVTVIAPTATDSDALAKPAYLLPRDALVELLAAREGVHAFRVEGTCRSGGAVWTTPWSSGLFAEE
jgi:thiamine biosynthesis lipoprotein